MSLELFFLISVGGIALEKLPTVGLTIDSFGRFISFCGVTVIV